MRRRAIAVAASAAAAALLSGCGSTQITPSRLEQSIAPTFGRLYLQQQAELGNPRPTLAAIHAGAQCQKGTPAQTQQGAGDDWVCYVTYLAAGAGTTVTATYNVSMQTDGCYAADGDGPASLNGSRTITGPGYAQVLNPLWLINGCFDVG